MRQEYDIAFLGGGPAGYQGAVRAAQLGARVALIEQTHVGGVCLNNGCIPTKTVRASAELARAMRRAVQYGFKQVEVVPDLASILARKERVVSGLRRSVEQLLHAYKIDLHKGRARIVGPQKIEVEKDGAAVGLHARQVVVATGSSPAGLPALPQGAGVFLADDVLTIPCLPGHLLVVGGGSIGVEMAAIFRELGSQVTLVEAKERLLPAEDAEMSHYLAGLFQRRKIKVVCGSFVASAQPHMERYRVELSDGTVLEPDGILVAVGRELNTNDIGLEAIGVAMDRSRILVDEHMQTSVPWVHAAGDVVGGWLLAHVAFAEGVCAAEHALGMDTRVTYRVVPRTTFSIPEYAAVGLSEEEAGSRYPVKVARFPFRSLGMSQALGELEGLVKVIAHAENDQILGAHIIGTHAGDLVAEIALAMSARIPSKVIMETIHGHPTLSEALLEAVQGVHGRAIHSLPKGAA